MAGTPSNEALLARLGDILSKGLPALLVEREHLPGAEALRKLASDHLDLALLSGMPAPELSRLLTSMGARVKVLTMGADVVAVLTNTTNRSSQIDLDGLGRALRGEASTWQDLGGDALPLVVYAPPSSSDLSGLLRAILLGGAPLGQTVRQVEDVETQLESARRTPGALAMVALGRLGPGQALPEAVKPLPVASKPGIPGSLPTDRGAAARGDYPLRLPIVAVLRQGDDPVARRLHLRVAGVPAAERSAWLGLAPLPDSDHERIRRLWASEGPSGKRAAPR
jgi:ABC-type phosphate transport system substrate-binding protein